MSTEVPIRDQKSVTVQQSPSDGLLAVIAQVSRDQSVDVSKLERLLDMQMQVIKFQREQAFNEDLASCQAEMPQLDQNGRIDYGKGKPINYALLEDIDAVIRPIYSRYGFAVAWNTDSVGDNITVIGDFKHRGGHSEQRKITLPADKSGGKNGAQAVTSTVSYGKRTLLKMFWNLVEKGTDLNGADINKITQQQADEINSLLTEVKADKEGFLRYMGYKQVPDILAKDYQKAINALQRKRQQ